MKISPNHLLGAVPIVALTSALACAAGPAPSTPTPTLAATPMPTAAEADAAWYALGVNLGAQLHQSGITAGVSMRRIEQGVKDGLAGRQVGASDQMRLQAYLRSAAQASAANNAALAHDFLARNAKVSGITTTPSGLQYKVLAPGNSAAASPGPTDLVTLDFRGRLLDGSEFDSSSKAGTASTVQANGVMRAWTEALSMMKPGAKWQLFVPPELGYGQTARLKVPGGSLLIYDLELVSVIPPSTAKTADTAGR